jgi:hypothetical protein
MRYPGEDSNLLFHSIKSVNITQTCLLIHIYLFLGLVEFVFKGNPPLFEEFVKRNKRDITIWCSQGENLCPSDLYNVWKRRFTLKLFDIGKIHLICDR